MYNIYFDKRVLKICDISKLVAKDPNTVIYNAALVSQTDKILPAMENLSEINSLVIPVHSDKLETTYKEICSQFTEINAAGGVVENENGEILLILRHGLWDLPKGKQEEGEDIATTAIREVQEECGIENLQQKELICITHHTYHMNGLHMLKHSYWYKMTCSEWQNTKPQIEEDIQEVRWVKKEVLAEYLTNTYPSIKEVISNL